MPAEMTQFVATRPLPTEFVAGESYVVEGFAPGRFAWNGREENFTPERINQIVANTRAVANEYPGWGKLPLKAGHTRDLDGQVGVIDPNSISVDDKGRVRFIADVTEPLMAGKIERGTLRFVSAEISPAGYTNEADGKVLGEMFTGFAVVTRPRHKGVAGVLGKAGAVFSEEIEMADVEDDNPLVPHYPDNWIVRAWDWFRALTGRDPSRDEFGSLAEATGKSWSEDDPGTDREDEPGGDEPADDALEGEVVNMTEKVRKALVAAFGEDAVNGLTRDQASCIEDAMFEEKPPVAKSAEVLALEEQVATQERALFMSEVNLKLAQAKSLTPAKANLIRKIAESDSMQSGEITFEEGGEKKSAIDALILLAESDLEAAFGVSGNHDQKPEFDRTDEAGVMAARGEEAANRFYGTKTPGA